MRLSSTKRLLAITLLCGTVSACASHPQHNPEAHLIGIPNPASVYCTQHGGRHSDVRSAGGETGVCLLPPNQVCDEWVLFREKRCVAPLAKMEP
ncbi:putative hemolysin [Gluconobacter aidae]|uniref:DUF333 domain-containing protein n=1 Tax=Gluconobacter aidae TaxID=2662454 RepID=A0A7X1VPL0_9PROT|nr:DUF333 domain-containing protein [Gluconobacter aidae]MQR99252.1 DUF333 domain-containing protein [Gluconobacter aidae]